MKRNLFVNIVTAALVGVLIPLALFSAAAGCRVVTDAVTGQKTYQIDTDITDKLEAGAEAGAALAPFLGGAGALVSTGLLGALAAWRKVKPTLTQAQTAEKHTHAAASAMVAAIQDFREQNPELWEKLGAGIKEQLNKQGIDPVVVENTIRGLRGLPPKA